MFCDTLLAFQSIKVLIKSLVCVQYKGAWRLAFAEILYKYSNTDFKRKGELRKLSDNPYRRAKRPILYINLNG